MAKTRQEKLDYVAKTDTVKATFNEMLKAARTEAAKNLGPEQSINEACWPWLNSTKESYGLFRYREKTRTSNLRYELRAHQLSHFLATGQMQNMPGRNMVLHKCNNSLCVNPWHLYVGSHRDNMKDLRDANTANPERKKKYIKKLSFDDVENIREEYALGNVTQSQLGKKYGVSQRNISYVLTGDVWPGQGGTLKEKREQPKKTHLKKLTEKQIRDIVCDFHFNKQTITELAKKYGVSTTAIYRAVKEPETALAYFAK